MLLVEWDFCLDSAGERSCFSPSSTFVWGLLTIFGRVPKPSSAKPNEIAEENIIEFGSFISNGVAKWVRLGHVQKTSHQHRCMFTDRLLVSHYFSKGYE